MAAVQVFQKRKTKYRAYTYTKSGNFGNAGGYFDKSEKWYDKPLCVPKEILKNLINQYKIEQIKQ